MPDPYFKKTLDLRVGRRHLKLDASQELFSSHDIDKGSRFLLRTLTREGVVPAASILDVGCGYGTLGLGLAEHHGAGRLVMVDRDALAVTFADANAARNGLHAESGGSLIYDDVVPEPFDLVVSNIPGKGTDAMYRHWVLGAARYLSPTGVAALVVVKPLAPVVADVLDGSDVLTHDQVGGHAVFVYRPGPSGPLEAAAFDAGVFDRNLITIRLGSLSYDLQAVHGLAEFDSLTHSTRLVAEMVIGGPPFESVICLNPGQGHLPVTAWRHQEPEVVMLVDRDLLALRASRANLVRNGCPDDRIVLDHRVTGIGAAADLTLDMVRPKEPFEAVTGRLRLWIEVAGRGSRLIVGGTSTSITRVCDTLVGRQESVLVERRRHGGFSAALFTHR